jgi:hypothetical protein
MARAARGWARVSMVFKETDGNRAYGEDTVEAKFLEDL